MLNGPQQLPLSRGTRLVVLAAVLVHVALLLAAGASWNHQHDEGITYDIALTEWDRNWRPREVGELRALEGQVDGSRVSSPTTVIAQLSQPARMPHPPAFYLLWNAWVRVGGTRTIPTRVPLYALSALTVLGIAALARRLVPHPSAAAWAAVLAAMNPWLVELANFLRPYGLALCAAVWATVLVLRVASPARRSGDVLLFALVSLLGIYTVYHYVFVLAWHLVFLTIATWRSAPRPRLRPTILVLLVLAAGYAPWTWRFLVHAVSNREHGAFFSGVVSLSEWPRQFGLLLERYAVGQEFPAYPLAWGLGLATLCLIWPAFRRGGGDRTSALAWGTAALLPASIQLADLLQGTSTLMVSKYSFGLFPLLLLLLVRAWTCGAWALLARAGLSLAALLFLAATVHAAWAAEVRPGPVRALVAGLSMEDRTSHLVVLSRPTRGHVLTVLLEARERGLRDVRVTVAPSSDLPRTLGSALDDPDTLRLTLVDFVVGERKSEPRWTVEALQEVRQLARRAGWEVRRCRAGQLARDAQPGDRRLTIVSPVRAETYHRPRRSAPSGAAENETDPGESAGQPTDS